MRAKKENCMLPSRSRSLAATSPSRRAGRTRRTALALAGMTLAGVCATSRPAAANLADQPGQAVGLAIEGILYACSVTSIVGNSVDIATKNPHRGWLYSGFICGFTNTVVSPVMLIFFNTAEPPYGVTTGALHGVVGVTNLALAIYNGVLWHRAQIAGKEPPKVSLLPIAGRDQLGASLVGLSLKARF